ncbi:MAG: SprT-like domain-containing protein [Oligoflexia bacterium]|nr:SprT-like domain-containing protein [Oligoflexia bacterium]
MQKLYFPELPQLRDYTVRWSRRRQKRVLATCNISRLIVSVAKELSYPDRIEWLEPLLYHEMCHAVLKPQSLRHRGRTRWHGPEFRALERRHPKIAELDRWIAEGGWRAAVRQARARQSVQRRTAKNSTQSVPINIAIGEDR